MSPDQKAQKLHSLLTKELVPNSYYDDSHMCSTKSPDYDKVSKFIKENIHSKEDLEGTHKNIPMRAMLKSAIYASCTSQLSDTGDIKSRLEMTQHLYKVSEKDPKLWEEKVKHENSKGEWLLILDETPGGKLVGAQLSYILNYLSLEEKKATRSLARDMASSPSFREGVESGPMDLTTQIQYWKSNLAKKGDPTLADNLLKQAAVAILKDDLEALHKITKDDRTPFFVREHLNYCGVLDVKMIELEPFMDEVSKETPSKEHGEPQPQKSAPTPEHD